MGNREFRLHASQAAKLTGRIGLTDAQTVTYKELTERKTKGEKPLTANMEAELAKLHHTFTNPELPQTAKTFLMEWYSMKEEEINSKYFNKGNLVENDNIDFMAETLGFGMAEKNLVTLHDEYFVGTCDVNLHDTIVDVKSNWDLFTLQRLAIDNYLEDYALQGQVYMHLYSKPKFILWHGLLDTPEEANYGVGVSWEHLPIEERWIAWRFNFDQSAIDMLIERIKMARNFLAEYDAKVKSKIGKLHIVGRAAV